MSFPGVLHILYQPIACTIKMESKLLSVYMFALESCHECNQQSTHGDIMEFQILPYLLFMSM